MTFTVQRLRPGDEALARRLFAMLAAAFEEDRPSEPLDDPYIAQLLADDSLWLLAAVRGGEVLGGLTAHALPMTRAATRELFLYDLAVDERYRRLGIGRELVGTLRRTGKAAGIPVVFVAADNEDTHALDFYHATGGDGSPVTVFTFGSAGL